MTVEEREKLRGKPVDRVCCKDCTARVGIEDSTWGGDVFADQVSGPVVLIETGLYVPRYNPDVELTCPRCRSTRLLVSVMVL